PTTWIWEGVVMYLTQRDIEATLRVVEKRSAPKSRLAIVYIAPALMLLVLAPLVKRMDEPLRSVFRPRGMSALLARNGFGATRGVGVADVARSMSLMLPGGGLTARHLRVVTADRASRVSREPRQTRQEEWSSTVRRARRRERALLGLERRERHRRRARHIAPDAGGRSEPRRS